MLKAESLSKRFGGLVVIRNLSFALQEGEILGVIGPNGSGKTTLFNMITGFLKAEKGRLQFSGRDILNKRPSAICQLGITRTFQIVKPFMRLTALENVMAGRSYGREPAHDLKQARREASEALDMVRLSEKKDVLAEHLQLIDRKRLEIARALAARPKLLLLDEVFAGLNPAEVEEALRLIDMIRKLGITIMIVEHVLKVILEVSERVLVLASGEKIFEGAAQEAINDRRVVEAYLGKDFHA
ncbi:MAG: ABC transporter ATP-binding protein [Deltaproteobacteria bacterium HGW-Deltaproteobacteria-21]|nr:MAG: ABC transporter ATP-binding protein [Deltaproteobacteria bacterium HGW-Deltaproteobacteria-21]